MFKKVVIILIFIILVFNSCNLFDDGLKNIYPEDIEVHNFGTLVYDRTILDNHSVSEMFLDNNQLWFQSSKEFNGKDSIQSYNIGTDSRTNHITEDIIQSGPMLCGNYIILEVSPLETGAPHQLKLIDKNSGEITVKSFPYNDPYVYTNVNSIILEFFDEQKYYKSDDYGSSWVEISEDTFNEYGLVGNNEDVIEDNGVYYRIIDESWEYTETYLEISLDGINWFRGDMGTNLGREIIIHNDYVYISCNWYYDYYIGFLPGPYTGGGIQVFKWIYDEV